ncbi:MAG TPA: flagellar biosynthetic protein FliO [Bryobacteraceae bacterium]|nr:flagellar biosynthetic protein FliO [Bryobacteraceae bacterium]
MDFAQDLGAVGVVLALLSGTLWWLRRRGFAAVVPMKRTAARRLECIERLSLGPQHTLHLVRVGDRALFLLASTPAGCALVSSLPSGDAEALREGVR